MTDHDNVYFLLCLQINVAEDSCFGFKTHNLLSIKYKMFISRCRWKMVQSTFTNNKANKNAFQSNVNHLLD